MILLTKNNFSYALLKPRSIAGFNALAIQLATALACLLPRLLLDLGDQEGTTGRASINSPMLRPACRHAEEPCCPCCADRGSHHQRATPAPTSFFFGGRGRFVPTSRPRTPTIIVAHHSRDNPSRRPPHYCPLVVPLSPQPTHSVA
jgi:hypothetical protein